MSSRRAARHFGPTIVLVAALLLPVSPVAQTTDCTNYADYMHWLRRVPVEPTPIGLSLVGDRAYVAASTSGLMIFDISDPATPVWLGTADTPANCQASLIIGDLAYVADAYSPGFCVIDVSDPTAPVMLGQTGGWTSYLWDLALAAPDTFYLADSYYGVRIVEATDPTDPTTVGGFNGGRTVWEVTVEGDLAFIPDDQGLKIYDITVTAIPERIGFAEAPGINYSLDRHGNHMFMACYDSLRVFDVSDPEAPALIGTHATKAPSTRIRIVGDTAYLSQSYIGNAGGLELFDVSDPTAPFSLGGFGSAKGIMDVEISGGHAFVTCEQRGLQSVELNGLIVPDLPDTLGLLFPTQVTGVGDLAYVTSNFEGLVIVDVASPGAPIALGRVGTLGDAHDVDVQGNYAYVAGGGLTVLNVTDPTDPFEEAFLYPLGTVVDVAVQGNYAYLAARDRGMHVINITDPTAPFKVTTLPLPDWATGVVVEGNYAYVACDDEGIQIVDISTPGSPFVSHTVPLDQDVANPCLVGNYLYVSGSEAGLHIIDVSSPLAATLVSTLLTTGTAWDVVVNNGVAYISDYFSGVQIADVSDPSAPFLAGTLNTPIRNSYGIGLAGGKICIADWESGFIMVDIDCRRVSATPELPARTMLTLTASPNPFNPGTTLSFTLQYPARVDLKVYDVAGRLVRTLISDQLMAPGPGRALWNGNDDQGRTVAAGVYLGRLTAGEQTAVGRMVIVK